MINQTSRNILFVATLVHTASTFSLIPLLGKGSRNMNNLISVTSDLQRNHYSDIKDTRMIARLSKRRDQEILAAEQAVVDEATFLSDSGMEAAVMERAVMLAHEIMMKKKKELKKKVEDARAAEQQYAMMEHATEDLVRQYRENPTKFKQGDSTEKGSQVEIDVLEAVIVEAAQKMQDVLSSQKLVISQFYELLEEEHQAEESDDPEKRNMTQNEEKLAKQLIEQKRNEKTLLADLREIQGIVQNWKSSMKRDIA